MWTRKVRETIIVALVLMLAAACGTPSQAACIPKDLPTPPPRDPVARVLAAQAACQMFFPTLVDVL